MAKTFPWDNAPITQDAENTITEAYNGNGNATEQSVVLGGQISKPDTASTASLGAQPSRTDTAQTAKLDERLQRQWEVYSNRYLNSIEIGANVKVPEGIDDRLEAIGKRMRKRKGDMKMPKKRLILLALMEFVEKYDK